MKPNKAAMEKALDKYYSMLDEPGWDDEEIIERVLQVAYDAQFGDEALYLRYPGSKPFGAIDPKTGAMAMWVVPAGGGEQ